MKRNIIKNIVLLLLFFILILSKISFTQEYDPFQGMHCYSEISTEGTIPPATGGAYKPERTDMYPNTNTNSVFQILIVFIEFKNDSVDMWNSDWPSNVVGGNGPTYKDDLLAESKDNSSSWWDAYDASSETLSDYMLEISRGHNHVIGKSFYIRLDSNASYYQANQKINRINSEIYTKLDNNPSVAWEDYDNWTYDGSTYRYERDGKIDMIYTVFRTYRPNLGVTPGSIAILYPTLQGNRFVVSTGDTIVSQGCECIDWKNSGCTFTPGTSDVGPYSPFVKNHFLTVQAHEIGHYHYGGCHPSYGIMAGGGCTFFTGLDSRHSPWETIKLGYGVPQIQNSTKTNYGLYDFSSRYSNDTLQVIQVPISGTNEFFLIANRHGLSDYDGLMHGDTCHDNPFREVNESYRKGIVIYHTPSGYNWFPQMDQECADGLYNWTQDGTRNPDWSNTQNVPYYIRTSVSYNNDQSYGSTSNADDKSMGSWFSVGKAHTYLGEDGTDRMYTNDQDVWTTRSWKGDRYDTWRPGYNEMFSPYSSPSTNNWNNDTTGIFIWNYQSTVLAGPVNLEYLKIYRTGQRGLSRDSILHLTPPSRPMGLRILECNEMPTTYSTIGIKIRWNHNMEPDMLRGAGDNFKRYRIYRIAAEDMSSVPDDAIQYSENIYETIATIDIHKDSLAEYYDNTVVSMCSEQIC